MLRTHDRRVITEGGRKQHLFGSILYNFLSVFQKRENARDEKTLGPFGTWYWVLEFNRIAIGHSILNFSDLNVLLNSNQLIPCNNSKKLQTSPSPSLSLPGPKNLQSPETRIIKDTSLNLVLCGLWFRKPKPHHLPIIPVTLVDTPMTIVSYLSFEKALWQQLPSVTILCSFCLAIIAFETVSWPLEEITTHFYRFMGILVFKVINSGRDLFVPTVLWLNPS